MTEQELLDKLKHEPQAGLESLIEQYAGLVYTIVRSKLVPYCSKEDVEECASDVFAAIFRQRDKIDHSKGSLRAYISTLARRTAISRYRSEILRKSTVSLDDDDIFPNGGESTVIIEDEFVSRETQRVVLDCVKALGDPDSEIIIRKYYYGQTAVQIANAVHLTPGAVQKRINRSLKKLRKALGSDNYEK